MRGCGLATEQESRSLEIIHLTEAIIFTLMDSDRDNADCLQSKVAPNSSSGKMHEASDRLPLVGALMLLIMVMTMM